MRSIEDALERELEVPERPARVVSLVPSLSELVVDLGAGERLVGVSRYCTEPAGPLAGLPRVGGQKDPDVDAIVALAPDLVLAVKEENHRRDVEALERRGVSVYVADVRSVEDALALIGEIADLVGAAPAAEEEVVRFARAGVAGARVVAARHPPVPVFCPIWRDPWMIAGPDTYVADVLRVCGAVAVPAASRGDRRYPKVTLDEVCAAAPLLALLPDEPYAFGAADVADLASFVHARLVDGKLLGWYGRRIGGIVELAVQIEAAGGAAGHGGRPTDQNG